jgi:hypothetical protein
MSWPEARAMNNPRGFTLVELLLATVLATILMIGVLAVITNLGARGIVADGGRSLEGLSESQAEEACVRLLREDLDQAISADATKSNVLRLSGYGALDARGREWTHRPVNVVYAIEEIDGRPWLTRRQEAMDVLVQNNVQRDLVCSVVRFELAKTPPANKDAPGEGRRAWRLRLWTTDGAEPSFDRFVTIATEDGA